MHLLWSGTLERESNNKFRQMLSRVGLWSCSSISQRILKMRAKWSSERRQVELDPCSKAVEGGGQPSWGSVSSWQASSKTSCSIMQVSNSKAAKTPRVEQPVRGGRSWWSGTMYMREVFGIWTETTDISSSHECCSSCKILMKGWRCVHLMP